MVASGILLVSFSVCSTALVGKNADNKERRETAFKAEITMSLWHFTPLNMAVIAAVISLYFK